MHHMNPQMQIAFTTLYVNNQASAALKWHVYSFYARQDRFLKMP